MNQHLFISSSKSVVGCQKLDGAWKSVCLVAVIQSDIKNNEITIRTSNESIIYEQLYINLTMYFLIKLIVRHLKAEHLANN